MKAVNDNIRHVAPYKIGTHRLAKGVPEYDEQHRKSLSGVYIAKSFFLRHTLFAPLTDPDIMQPIKINIGMLRAGICGAENQDACRVSPYRATRLCAQRLLISR